MRLGLLLAWAVAVIADRKSYNGYSVFRMSFNSLSDLNTTLAACETNAGCDVWRTSGLSADICTNTTAILGAGPITVLIKDVQQAILEAEVEAPSVDPFFAKYQRYADVVQKTKTIAAAVHGGVFIPSIGKTYEGRDIFGMTFGGGDSPVANVYVQGGIHAREWISPATVMYIANELATSTDAHIRQLVSQIKLTFIPLLNSDGYEYCFTNERMWRKNRAPNSGSQCIGTDLNRNWADHWGGPGSSGDPCSDTYRGTKAFSELESSAVRDYLNNQPVQTAGIDFHSYGQLVLRPYGWQLPNKGVPPNEAELKKLTDGMAAAIKATHGKVYTSEHAAELYVACGGADDWFYSVATKGRIGLTIELRDTGQSGFLLPAAQIVPTGQEALAAFLVLLDHVAKPTAEEQ